jgi:hypothetical protein
MINDGMNTFDYGLHNLFPQQFVPNVFSKSYNVAQSHHDLLQNEHLATLVRFEETINQEIIELKFFYQIIVRRWFPLC